MKNIKDALLNFYIYSSIHVSFAAALFSAELFILTGQRVDPYFIGFVFSSTLLIYALHRIIGLKRVSPAERTDRYLIIQKFHSHILVYALLSIIGLLFFTSKLSIDTIKYFIPAGVISILYVLPLLGGKRLRDLSFIKVFLIAAVWAYTGMLALLNWEAHITVITVLIIFLERFVYILGITLPFDIRDIKIDRSNAVKTLGTEITPTRLYNLIYLFLTISFLAWTYLFFCTEVVHHPTYLAAGLAILISYCSILISKGKTKDVYYSGLLDGVIIVRSLLIMSSLIFK